MADMRNALSSLETGVKNPPKAPKVDKTKVEPKSEVTERIIERPKRGPDGLFEQPQPEKGNEKRARREMQERLNRMMAAEVFNYADELTGNTATFDKDKKNYACGDCNKEYGKGNCTLIKIIVDEKAGSCRAWERKRACDPELDIAASPHAATAESMAYGVAKNGEGFGCHRCPFAEKAFEADSIGRSLYCKQFDARIQPAACCALNGAEVEGYFEGNEPSKEESEEENESYESPEEEATEHESEE